MSHDISMHLYNGDPDYPLKVTKKVTPEVLHTQTVSVMSGVAASFGMSQTMETSARLSAIAEAKVSARVDATVSSKLETGLVDSETEGIEVSITIHGITGPCSTKLYQLKYDRFTAEAEVWVGDLRRCTRLVPIPGSVSPIHGGVENMAVVEYCFDGAVVASSSGRGSDMKFDVIANPPQPYGAKCTQGTEIWSGVEVNSDDEGGNEE